MADPIDNPLPDPRIDPIYSASSEEEEEDDIFALVETNPSKRDLEDDHKHIEKTEDTKSKTTTKRKLSKKSRKKSKKDLVCVECSPNRFFKTQKILDLHQKYIHKEVKYVVCMWCAKQFMTQNQLEVHQLLYSHDKPLD